MQEPPPVADLLAQLRDFGTAVAGFLSAPAMAWQARPVPGEWSLTELACHLRDVEREVHQPRFQALLAKENAFLAGVVADEWVVERAYQTQDGRAALADFVRARQETVQLLSDVSPTLWQRQGRHAFFGPTTMHELLNLMVKHDEAHLAQMEQLTAVASKF